MATRRVNVTAIDPATQTVSCGVFDKRILKEGASSTYLRACSTGLSAGLTGLAGNDRGEDLLRAARCAKLLNFVAQDLPVIEVLAQFVRTEQAVAFRGEHIHERCPLDKDIDSDHSTWTQMRLQRVQLTQRGWAIEEHQQADAHDCVVVVGNREVAQICFVSMDGKRVPQRHNSDALYGSMTGVQRGDVTATSGRLYGEVSQATAKVQHFTGKVRQRCGFEWVECVVISCNLPLKLLIEELDAAGGVHRVGV